CPCFCLFPDLFLSPLPCPFLSLRTTPCLFWKKSPTCDDLISLCGWIQLCLICPYLGRKRTLCCEKILAWFLLPFLNLCVGRSFDVHLFWKSQIFVMIHLASNWRNLPSSSIPPF